MKRNQQFGHIMVDLETMGHDSYSSIVSIGAVEFNLATGETGEEFYTNVSLESCLNLGLIINADTVMWWMKQSDAARKELYDHDIHIAKAIQQFSEFVERCGGKSCQVWGNSARFDLGILSDAYVKLQVPTPWSFTKERCVRTLVAFNPDIKKNTVFKGTAHNALHDCLFQIQYCSDIFKYLTNS